MKLGKQARPRPHSSDHTHAYRYLNNATVRDRSRPHRTPGPAGVPFAIARVASCVRHGGCELTTDRSVRRMHPGNHPGSFHLDRRHRTMVDPRTFLRRNREPIGTNNAKPPVARPTSGRRHALRSLRTRPGAPAQTKVEALHPFPDTTATLCMVAPPRHATCALPPGRCFTVSVCTGGVLT